MKRFALASLLALTACQSAPPSPPRPRVRTRAPAPAAAPRAGEELPTVRIRGKGASARLAPSAPAPLGPDDPNPDDLAPARRVWRSARQALAAAEEAYARRDFAAASARAKQALQRAPALDLALRAEVVLSRAELARGAWREAVLVLDRALAQAHAEGASPVQLATLAFWRAWALSEAGRILEAHADLEASQEALTTGEWFAARFRLDGVPGLAREVVPPGLLRERIAALRAWLRRVLVQEGRLAADEGASRDRAEAPPEDALIRDLRARAPRRPRALPGLRRWQLSPLPTEGRLQWLARAPSRGAKRAEPPSEPEARAQLLQRAWTTPEDARALVAIARALALPWPNFDERLEQGALLVRRGRVLRLLGRDEGARLDEERGRALLAAELGRSRWPALRLEAELARRAFWGGDFDFASRLAAHGLTLPRKWQGTDDQLYDLAQIMGQLWASHGLSHYVLASDLSQRARAQRLPRLGIGLWLAELYLGEVAYGRWVARAERAARARLGSLAPLPAIPSHDPTQGRSLACAQGKHPAGGPCAGPACQPSTRARLLGFAGR